MLPARPERLEDWLREPVEASCADPRFEVRRATPDDYPAIFELIDRVFERPRSRRFDDWLYRRNPAGQARCWITLERATGELVANETRLPWPFARGTEALPGEMIADAAVTPRLQRQDLGDLRAPFRMAHPWYPKTAAISWPNGRSRRAAIKHGYAHRLFGPLPYAEMPLSTAAVLKTGRWPGALRLGATPLVALGDRVLAAWHHEALGRAHPAPPGLSVRRIDRFEAGSGSGFDRVTETCMARPGLWSPHGAAFLDWRYLDHPTHRYAALGAWRGDEPTGYAVVRLDGDAAMLMELAALERDAACRRALLAGVRALAVEAGCDRIGFLATRSFPHWSALRRGGFVPRRSVWWVQARAPGETGIDAWQLLPGDTDVL